MLKSYSQDELCEPKHTDSPQTTKGSKYRPFDVSSLMRKSPEKSPKRQSQSPSSPELTVSGETHSVSQMQIAKSNANAIRNANMQVGAPPHPPPPPSLHPYLGLYHQLLGGAHINTVLFKTTIDNNNNNNLRSISLPTNLPVPASPEHQPSRPLQPIPRLSLRSPQLWSRSIWFGLI